MARLARVVVSGVTQRGNRRQAVFFGDADYKAYKGLLAEGCRAAKVAVWAYCLMPNHQNSGGIILICLRSNWSSACAL